MRAFLCHVLIVLYFGVATATYFTMSNMKMKLPVDRMSLETSHPLLTTLHAENDGAEIKFQIAQTSGSFLLVNSSSGDVILNKGALENVLQDVGNISANLTAVGGNNDIAWTTFEIDVLPTEAGNCDLISQDLCFWHSVSYSIKENSVPGVIGSLTSPYLVQTCKGYDVNYTVIKGNDDIELVPPDIPSDPWIIKSARSFERDLSETDNGTRPDLLNVTVECKIHTPLGYTKSVSKDLALHILDVNDNAPEPQEPELIIPLEGDIVSQNSAVEHSFFIFHDKDSPEVNNYKIELLDDRLGIFKPDCIKHENDRHGTPQTALSCKLIVTEGKQLQEPSYTVVLQVNDTSLLHVGSGGDRDGTVRIPIHLRTNKFLKGSDAKQFNRPLLIYPHREVQVFQTAAPLARVTQPTPNLAQGATNFSITPSNPAHNDAFGVTDTEGIVYVYNVKILNKSSPAVRLNIQWQKDGTYESDEILVNIIHEPTPTCTSVMGKMKLSKWKHCSGNTHKRQCEATCGLSTGGAPNVIKRRQGGLQRCMWHGDETPGNQVSKIYSTCTPDSSTCPDGICDSLEQLFGLVCPQDCTERVDFPTTKNSYTNRGILQAAGVCYCDESTSCRCDTFVAATEKAPELRNLSRYHKPAPLSIKDKLNSSPETLAGNEDTCGTTCMISIAAGALFLVTAAAVTVACWRLDKVHKVVRGKVSDDTQDLSAPLSDYVDRGVMLDNLQLNFDMTTALRDNSEKYAPDPKWEFPRSQLIIEQTLGEGEFGRVLRARALNIAGRTGYTTVAVKTLKEDARESELADLLSEYQLLRDVNHTNVIHLLGACTVPGGPVYLIIEFAQHGSLRNYLRRSRHLKSENILQNSLQSNDRLNDSNPTPEHYDEPRVIKVTSREILSFAWQICKGMAYLTDIKLVHRDLAARNVLLAEGKICKISDFGLTRDIYEDDAYFKKSKGRVPVKWMAPESLSDHIYTSKSDVWSFGVLVWELVTLGASPYPGIAVQNLFHLLKTGYRMEKPENCSIELYKIMRNCWEINSEDRPSFHKLAAQFEKMLTDQVDYLDLTSNAILNRSYFCSPLDDESDTTASDEHKDNTEQLNYLNRSQSYIKCGETEKMLESSEESTTACSSNSNNNNNNNNNTQGYETPVKIKRVVTPTNECPQYYTDMAAGNRKQS